MHKDREKIVPDKKKVFHQKLLTRVSDYYHSALKDSKEGRAKLKELGIVMNVNHFFSLATIIFPYV